MRKIIIAYIVCIALAFLIVPWHGQERVKDKKSTKTVKINAGYGLLFSPPANATEINFKQVGFEVVGLTLIAGTAALYVRAKEKSRA